MQIIMQTKLISLEKQTKKTVQEGWSFKHLFLHLFLKPPQQLYDCTCTCTCSCQCGRPWCKTCAHIRTRTRFCSQITNEEICIQGTACCPSTCRNVVYMTENQKCEMQCIEETETPLHLRMNVHRSDYYHILLDKPVGNHFNTLGHFWWPYGHGYWTNVYSQFYLQETSGKLLDSHTLQSLTSYSLNLDP